MKRIFPLIFISILAASCSIRKAKSSLTVDQVFVKGMEYYKKGKYSKAIDFFNRILFEFPRSRYVDDAQFYLAQSYLMSKDYDNAINEFKFLISQFPNSVFIEQAYIGLIKAYISKTPNPELDQSDTKKGIRIAREFLVQNPDTKYREDVKALIREGEERLATKLYLISETYRHLRQYRAEKIYLEYLLEQYPYAKIAKKARERLAECNERLNGSRTVSVKSKNPQG